MSYPEASELRRIHPDKKIVTIRGAFDVLHIGHIRTFIEAKALGDILVVSLDSNEVVRARKPNRPMFSQEIRQEFLLQLKPVDYVYISDVDGAYDILEELNPHILVVKDETDTPQSGSGSRSEVIKFCNEHSIRIVSLKSKAGMDGSLFSTSSILNHVGSKE